MTEEKNSLEKDLEAMKQYLAQQSQEQVLTQEREFRKEVILNQERIIQGLNQIGQALAGNKSEDKDNKEETKEE